MNNKQLEKSNYSIKCSICNINNIVEGKNKCAPCINPNINVIYTPVFAKNIWVPENTPEDQISCAFIYTAPSDNNECSSCYGNKVTEFRSGNTIGPK